MSAGDVATYSVPNCPWCGMLSRSKPEQHREWETVCMECGSEIYPPRATSPSAQSKACKEIAALRRQVEEMRASADTVTVPRDRLTELVRRFLELAETVGQFKELAKIDERHLQDAGFRAQRVQP